MHQKEHTGGGKLNRLKQPVVLATTLAAIFALGILGCHADNAHAGSITVTINDNSADLNLVATEGSIAYGESDTASFSVSTTSSGGYTTTITGGNSTGRLTGTDSSNYFSPITTVITSPADFNNGTWGFKPSTYNSVSNTSYQPVATSSSAATIDVTNYATTGNYTLSVAAKTDTNTNPDTYSYDFVVSATTNAIDYDVSYENPGSGIPTRTIGSTTGSTITLSTETPTMNGYNFAGWCTQSVTPGSSCTGTTYQPGSTYTLDSGSNNAVTFYALWTANNFFKIGSMQDMTSAICAATTTPSASATQADTDGSHAGDTNYVPRTTLRDTRDGTTYLVSKLADGNCWMSQNLELKLTENVAVEAYDFDTNSTYSWTSNHTTQTSTGTTWAQDGSDGARSYAFPDNRYYGGTDINTPASASTTGQPYEKAGVLYNWYAATAGTGGTSSTSEVYGSICPKGWRLPAKDTGASNSFSHLAGVYGLPTTNTTGSGYSRQLQFPIQFNRSGHYYWSNGQLNALGAQGFYWSSVGSSTTTYAYDFGFGSSTFYPQEYSSKGQGFAVRCVND